MTSRSFLTLLLVNCLFFFTNSQDAAPPIQVVQSRKTYGPDGPWNAVTVELGDSTLDLYPRIGDDETLIFTNQLCVGVTATPCGSGGLYAPEESSDFDNSSISDSPSTGDGGHWSLFAQKIDIRNASYVLDTLQLDPDSADSSTEVANLSIAMISNFSIINPDGSRYPPQLGHLSLGAPYTNRSYEGENSTNVNGSLIPSYLAASGTIPSSSWGLHIGSVAFNIPLSLWFGGYDAKRISGPVATNSFRGDLRTQFKISLFDIGLGVDNGGSPFPYDQKDGLLATGNSSISNSMPVGMNPGAPYLALPRSTCEAIAKELPVTYNEKYGLYFWNVDDPQYTRIVTSPTYLSFIFDNEFTIKVPFVLLNLTLEAPLIDTPTQYFPCQPPQDSDDQLYSLGRAFLQAAFLGVYFESDGQWFLAQAPGPGVGTVAQQLPISSPSIPATPDNWASSWESKWTPLPLTESSGEESSSSSDGLSGGAIAGIVIGALAAVAIGLLIGFVLLRRRRPHGPALAALLPGYKDKDEKSGEGGEIEEAPPQYATASEPQEMDNTQRNSELPAMERTELIGSPVEPEIQTSPRPENTDYLGTNKGAPSST